MPTPPADYDGIYEILSQNSTLVGLLPGGFWSEVLPDTFTRPCLLFTGMSGMVDELLNGTISGALVDRRIQFDILVAKGRQADVAAIRKELISLFTSGYRELVIAGSTFQLLNAAPQSYGNYLPDEIGLRYTIDFYISFGI